MISAFLFAFSLTTASLGFSTFPFDIAVFADRIGRTMSIVFPRSAPEIVWNAFAKRFSVEQAKDFYGIIFDGVGFSYRHGNISTVKGKLAGQIYWRVTWKNPLDVKHASLFDYVIFHSPKCPESKEAFYVHHKRTIAKWIAENRSMKNMINVPARYRVLWKRPDDWRMKFTENPIPASRLIATLRHLTKKRS